MVTVDFCENTTPVPLYLEDIEPFKPFPVYLLTHKGEWLEGNAQITRENAESLYVQFSEQVEGGTSGGPIVNESGDLVGVVSFAGGPINESGEFSQQACSGGAPRPHLALPVWVTTIMRNADMVVCDS